MVSRTEEEKDVVRQRRTTRLERRLFRRTLINIYIVFHFTAIAIWLLPASSGLSRGLLEYFQPYMASTGLLQGWLMFAPNPDQTDYYIQAKVTLTGGHVLTYTFPRMVQLGYAARYEKERFRKFQENVRNNQLLRAPVCKWVARQYAQDGPVKVDLYNVSRAIPPIGSAPGAYSLTHLYTYIVQPEDLR